MSAEGWGLYAESLMAEPEPGAPSASTRPKNGSISCRASSIATSASASTPACTQDACRTATPSTSTRRPWTSSPAPTPSERAAQRRQARQLQCRRGRDLPLLEMADQPSPIAWPRRDLRAAQGSRRAHWLPFRPGAVPSALHRRRLDSSGLFAGELLKNCRREVSVGVAAPRRSDPLVSTAQRGCGLRLYSPALSEREARVEGRLGMNCSSPSQAGLLHHRTSGPGRARSRPSPASPPLRRCGCQAGARPLSA